MIWTIVSKDEMENYNIPPIFKYYREVVGKENITLKVVDEDDDLDFVDEENDMILLRSANKNIVNRIKAKGIKSTSEDFSVYEHVRDKVLLGDFLLKNHIQVPRQYKFDEVEDGKKYFVKPRFGSESFGITKDCICCSKDEVFTQIKRIEEECNQEAMIEEFIEGVDCTTACVWNPVFEVFNAYAIKVECDELGGIQTHNGKFNYDEYCSALDKYQREVICGICRNVIEVLGICHHARIDFRMTNTGDFYLIDVNLLPGLGPTAHFAKCMLLDGNYSYKDAIYAILNSNS